MKILFLIQSFIPKEKFDEYSLILKKTIKSIKHQQSEKKWSIEIALFDDGSDYLKNFCNNQIYILSNEILEKINNKYGLYVDKIILTEKSKYFNKAELFNFYLKTNGHLYDMCIFLDDDNYLIKNDSLYRFVKHYKNGYNYIAGRLCSRDGKFRTFYDSAVQGTTFGVTSNLLKDLNYWSERVKKWGCGDDSEMFWKIYKKYEEGKVKAIYDGNIITQDLLSGRWFYCQDQVGGVGYFIEDFLKMYGVHPHKNKSREKKTWMDLELNDIGVNEKLFKYITLEEYLSFLKNNSYFILWYLKFSINIIFPVRRIFKYIKRIVN